MIGLVVDSESAREDIDLSQRLVHVHVSLGGSSCLGRALSLAFRFRTFEILIHKLDRSLHPTVQVRLEVGDQLLDLVIGHAHRTKQTNLKE